MRRMIVAGSFALAMQLSGCGGNDLSESSAGVSVSPMASESTLGLARVPGQSLDFNIADNAREKATTASAVFRFAKKSSGAYFYTGSSVERDLIVASFPDFRYEGPAFGSTPGSGGVAVYRFAKTDSGGYFFTSSAAERDDIITSGRYPNFRYEGVTFAVADARTQGARPVYRLANLVNGSYLLTQDADERAAAIATGIWRDEGIGFHAYPAGYLVDDGPAANAEQGIPDRAARIAAVAIAHLSRMGYIVELGRNGSRVSPFDGTCDGGGRVTLSSGTLTMLDCRFTGGTAASTYGGISSWTLSGTELEAGSTTVALYQVSLSNQSFRLTGSGSDIQGTLRFGATATFTLRLAPRSARFESSGQIHLDGLSGDLEGDLILSGLRGRSVLNDAGTVLTSFIESGQYTYSGSLGRADGVFVAGTNTEPAVLDPNRPPVATVRDPGTEAAFFLSRSKNCTACHAMDKKLIGPAYVAVADRYRNTGSSAEVLASLVKRIREGGVAAWGQIPMPANPQVTSAEAQTLAAWILSL